MNHQPVDLGYLKDLPHGMINIVAVGKTGQGKSSTLNTMLRALGLKNLTEFRTGQGATSVTKAIDHRTVTVSNPASRVSIRVIDTIGLFDTEMTEDYDSERVSIFNIPEIDAEHEQVLIHLAQVMQLASDGIHAFLFVVRGDDRFSLEHRTALQVILRYFGARVLDYAVFVITHASPNETGESVLLKMQSEICKFLQTRGYDSRDLQDRFVFFDNTSPEGQHTQVDRALRIIESNMRRYGMEPYTHAAFKDAKIELDKMKAAVKQRLEAELQDEIRKETDQIEAKYQKQMEEIEKEKQLRQRQYDELKNESEETKKRLKQEIEELELRRKQAEADRQQQMAALQQQMQEKQCEIDRLKKSCSEFDDKQRELKADLKKMQSRYEEVELDKQRAAAQHAKQIQQLESKVDYNQRQLEQRESDWKTAKKKLEKDLAQKRTENEKALDDFKKKVYDDVDSKYCERIRHLEQSAADKTKELVTERDKHAAEIKDIRNEIRNNKQHKQDKDKQGDGFFGHISKAFISLVTGKKV